MPAEEYRTKTVLRQLKAHILKQAEPKTRLKGRSRGWVQPPRQTVCNCPHYGQKASGRCAWCAFRQPQIANVMHDGEDVEKTMTRCFSPAPGQPNPTVRASSPDWIPAAQEYGSIMFLYGKEKFMAGDHYFVFIWYVMLAITWSRLMSTKTITLN